MIHICDSHIELHNMGVNTLHKTFLVFIFRKYFVQNVSCFHSPKIFCANVFPTITIYKNKNTRVGAMMKPGRPKKRKAAIQTAEKEPSPTPNDSSSTSSASVDFVKLLEHNTMASNAMAPKNLQHILNEEPYDPDEGDEDDEEEEQEEIQVCDSPTSTEEKGQNSSSAIAGPPVLSASQLALSQPSQPIRMHGPKSSSSSTPPSTPKPGTLNRIS